jgi:hypothetical protein
LRGADASSVSRNSDREAFSINQTRKKISTKSSTIVSHLVDIRTTRTALQDLKAAREAERQAAREAERETADEKADAQSTETSTQQTQTTPSSSGGLPALLLTIRANESGGNYAAYNGTGCEGYGCGGAYQLHLAYADDWAVRYGVGEWASTPPQQWPAEVQDTVALGLFYSTNPDGQVWCAWASYC